MRRKTLDDLLRGWSEHHGGEAAWGEALAERVRRELSRQPMPPPGDDLGRVGRKPLPRAAAFALCGLGAGLLVFVGLWGASRFWRGPAVEEPPAETALLSATEIQGDVELFRRMEELFDGDLRWVAEANGEVSLGLGRAPQAGVSQATPLVIRLVVVERKRGDSSWNKVLTADVLTRNEELVEAAPSRKGDGRLLVWAYRLADGNVAVDASLRLAGPRGLNVDLTNVLTPGEAREVFALRTAEGEFRVFQAASPLSSRKEAPWSGSRSI